MTKAYAQASVSLDGYIAGPGGTGFDRLFAWCTAGDVVTPSRQPERLIYRTNSATAAYLRELLDETGAVVVGRRPGTPRVIEGLGVTHLIYQRS